MNKEQKTITAIQKAVPSIMELKKGCKVFIQNYAISLTIIDVRPDDWCCVESKHQFPFLGHAGNNNDDLQRFGKKHIIEIIGRPITLEDCLVAIFKEYNARTDWEQGSAMEFDMKLLQLIQLLWVLGEPFTEQPQKTKDFIGDLILNK